MCKHANLGGPGGIPPPPRKFWNLDTLRWHLVASETHYQMLSYTHEQRQMYTNSDAILDSYHNIILQENVQKILRSFWLLKVIKAAAKLKFSIGGPSKSIRISVSSVSVLSLFLSFVLMRLNPRSQHAVDTGNRRQILASLARLWPGFLSSFPHGSSERLSIRNKHKLYTNWSSESYQITVWHRDPGLSGSVPCVWGGSTFSNHSTVSHLYFTSCACIYLVIVAISGLMTSPEGATLIPLDVLAFSCIDCR